MDKMNKENNQRANKFPFKFKTPKSAAIAIIASLVALAIYGIVRFNYRLPIGVPFTTTTTTQAQTSSSSLKPIRRFESTAVKCVPGIPISDLRGSFKSQSKEDETLLNEFFGGVCGGTYLEMGGLDGVLYSNTYVFEKKLGWKGVLVELGPRNFEKLQMNRPNEIATVNAAVCGERQTLHYVEKDAVGGIWEFATQSFRDQWWRGMKLENTSTVECSPLKDILEEHAANTTYYDFFSLDVEGAEFDALLSLDYDKVGFGIIFAEADAHNARKNNALRTYLDEKGYTYLWRKDRSDWYINKQFHSIYEKFIH